MPHGHFAKTLQPGKSQLDGEGATVARTRSADHQAFTFKLVSNSRYVPARYHQLPGEFVHSQSAGAALQLCHQIEARQCGIELAPQAKPNMVLNAYCAREQTQPQAQGMVVALLGARLQIKHHIARLARTVTVFAHG